MYRHRTHAATLLAVAVLLTAWPADGLAQGFGELRGAVTDRAGGPLPGATVEARLDGSGGPAVAITDAEGRYALAVAAGTYDVRVSIINFAAFSKRAVSVRSGEPTIVDAPLTLAISADVTVTGKASFTNLADVEDPTANLVGVAFAASQGAVTARQLERRPIMRSGEVLETVPGVVISQHSGEGKANQYYLRGFNLDHGTDFSTTVAGIPVNLPTNGHGHGYSDASFLIPELVSGVQYSKGPYFAEQGDFSAAGAASINYTNRLDRFMGRVSVGEDGWGRVLVADSPRAGRGNLLYALELGRNGGPWVRPDEYEKVNGILRYTQGDSQNGLSVTAMAYRALWNSTDQVPARAIESGAIDRFGLIDSTNGGGTSRYSVGVDWQRSRAGSVTRASVFGFHYGLDLFSNFTYALDDEENGDQFEQTDFRFVTGARVTHRTIGVWRNRTVQHTFGLQARNDNIGQVGLYHTRRRERLSTVREDKVLQTSGAVFYEHKYQWSPVVRTALGLRADLYHFRVDSNIDASSGSRAAGIVSPKGGLVLGPFRRTEVYVNAGLGFHSNDARGATITIDPVTGDPAPRVTPLVRAAGAELGLRTVAVPRTQLTFTLWTLGLESELLFVGDAGTTEASRPSRRTGIEATAYVRPWPWLTFDGDLAVSRSRFTDRDPAGDRIPGAVQTVVSGGVSVDPSRGLFGSLRLRYFGPRPLVEDDSVHSKATSLINLEAGYRFSNGVRAFVDVFNVFNAEASDVDYFYRSRLPGEPAGGVDDIHLHPTLPRTVRVGLSFEF